MRSVPQKVARARDRARGIDHNNVAKDVREIISEIKAGKWPDDAALSPILTVGQCKATPDFERNNVILHEITAAYLGRLCRAICLEEGIKLDELPMRLIVDILQPTDRIQEAAVNQIITYG